MGRSRGFLFIIFVETNQLINTMKTTTLKLGTFSNQSLLNDYNISINENFTNVENNALTPDELLQIQTANAPSLENPFATIGDLPIITEVTYSPAAALTGTEIVPIVQGGVTVQTTAQDVADLVEDFHFLIL